MPDFSINSNLWQFAPPTIPKWDKCQRPPLHLDIPQDDRLRHKEREGIHFPYPTSPLHAALFIPSLNRGFQTAATLLGRDQHRHYFVKNEFVFVSYNDAPTRLCAKADLASIAVESSRVLKTWDEKWMKRVSSLVSQLGGHVPSSPKATKQIFLQTFVL